MTHDGVGVLARSDLFGKEHKPWTKGSASKVLIDEAQKNMADGHWASALFHLKEAWHFSSGNDGKEMLRQMWDMQMKVYTALGREIHAKKLKEEYDWLG
jgi:hypothetical protein